MSAILAIFNRDGRPVDSTLVEKMLAASSHRAVDGQGTWQRGNIALAHQHFWIAPEEVNEEQPLADSTSQARISCDARLDNRDALVLDLGLDPGRGKQMSDAALVLRAYQKWATDCVEHLLGDFAFIIWDEREQQLFLARDPLGCREAHYFLNDDVCLIASEITQLLAHPIVPRRINEGKVAEYLAVLWDDQEETFYESIYCCPPAHCMVITADSVRKWRYWDVDPHARIRYRDDREYAQHFLELLTEAVRCRLRSAYPVGVAMSGGLDSTSVAALAATLLPEMSLPQTAIKSFSRVFDELESADEREFIQPMVDRYQLDATFIVGDDRWPLRDYEHWWFNQDTAAQDLYMPLTTALWEAGQRAGCRLILFGQYADRLLAGQQFWAAAMLHELKLGQMVQAIGNGADLRIDILVNGLYKLLPEELRRAYRRVRRKSIHWTKPGVHPDLRERVNLIERSIRYPRTDKFPIPGQREHYRLLVSSYLVHGSAAARQLSTRYGLQPEDPFRDRRLVEFAMAIPAYQLGCSYRPKSLLRQAMRDYLPQLVRERRRKTSLQPLWEKGLLERERESVMRIFSDPEIVRRKYIDADWLRQELNVGTGWAQHGYLLWLCLGLELWLKRFWSQRI